MFRFGTAVRTRRRLMWTRLRTMDFSDECGAWRSLRVSEKDLMKALDGIEAEGKCETKFIVPHRLPTGNESGDALYVVVVRERSEI